ncbi:MAG: glutamine amidotransferase [Planctomyces sp.]
MFSANCCITASIVSGSPSWIVLACLLTAAGIVSAVWWNRGLRHHRMLSTCLRMLGITLLTISLINPLQTGMRARDGENVLAIVADVSRSHQLAVSASGSTRADELSETLRNGELNVPEGWLHRAARHFELRRFAMSDRLRPIDRFDQVACTGNTSAGYAGLSQLKTDFEGQPLAGIVLLSDGQFTDRISSATNPVDGTDDKVADPNAATKSSGSLRELLRELPPVYPVILSEEVALPDVSIGSVSLSQTAFDDAPVTIMVHPEVQNADSLAVRVTLKQNDGQEIESIVRPPGETQAIRFQHRPDSAGTTFYRLSAALVDATGEVVSTELTSENNEYLLAADRGGQPRRILYICGRPNWEFKFLRRAAQSDPLLQLAGLIRVAKKESRFDFRGHRGERSNSLFRGFDSTEQSVVEEYDEPVFIRIGTRDADELRGGIPKTVEELFQYDAIILDDIESGAFLAEQMKLLQEFVSRRGGGFLMTGGQESFRAGGYDRTPIGEMIPVDLARSAEQPAEAVRIALTRDGWLQPWVRLRSDENAEQERLEKMPGFLSLNAVRSARPGAMVLAEVEDMQNRRWPALVAQRFGRGRTAALCIADFWRWRLNDGRLALERDSVPLDPDHKSEDLSDHSRASRQLLRWLVSDVPRRLDIEIQDATQSGSGLTRIRAMVRGTDFHPADDADVRLTVTAPDGSVTEMTAEPSDTTSGTFESLVATPQSGAWRVRVHAKLPAAEAKGNSQNQLEATGGWAHQPEVQEMKSVTIHHQWLAEIAEVTGGRVISLSELDRFIDRLPHEKAPVMETWSWPLWHQWWVFVTAVGCLLLDWTLRRQGGLP